MSNEIDTSKRSVVVKLLADIASQGKYDGMSPTGARNMNAVFDLTAKLINDLEAEEKQEIANLTLDTVAEMDEVDDETKRTWKRSELEAVAGVSSDE